MAVRQQAHKTAPSLLSWSTLRFPVLIFVISFSFSLLSWHYSHLFINRTAGSFTVAERNIPLFVLLAGVFFSIMIFGILWSFSLSRGLAMTLASQMTSRFRQTKEYTENLIESASLIIISINTNFQVELFNHRAERITGFKKEEVLGKNWFELMLPQSQGVDVKTRFRNWRAGNSELPWSLETNLITKSGDYRWISWQNNEIFEGNKIVGVISFGVDITERRKAEQALQESEMRYAVAMKATNDVIWDWDLIKDEVTWSENIERFGYLMKDVHSGAAWWTDHIHPEDRPRIITGLNADTESGKLTWSDEYRFQRADGSYANIVDRSYLIRDESGRAVRMIGSMMDITEKVKLENQLMQSQKMETMGTLAGGIAHDLNNQLTPVVGYIDLILKMMPEDDPKSALLIEAKQAARQCSGVVERILNFSRPSAHKKMSLNLAVLLNEFGQILKTVLPSSIETRVVFDSDLRFILSNETEMHTVLMNLCLNAKDAMPQRHGQVLIRAENVYLSEKMLKAGFSPGNYVKLSVADTGGGISSKNISRIFDPFFTTKKRADGSGSGLGLAMVFNIVKDHGGWIDVESQEGKGTTFIIYFPAQSVRPITQDASDVKLVLPTGKETILFADDEPTLRNVGKLFLERLGYRVLIAQDGEEALRLYEEHRDEIDAVILDMTMPKVSGKKAMQKILSMNPSTKIIMASGYTSEGSEEEFIGAGASDYIRKPYTILPFAQTLRRVLDSC